MSEPAVLLLLFNRPDLALQVFDGLRQARISRLFIAVDGPRATHPADAEGCAKCRALAEMVDWPCEIHTLFRESNLGCYQAVKGALGWFFEHVEEGIILEDDCVPHPSFFQYCSVLLERYRDDQRILTVGGSNMGHRKLQASYGFTPYMNMWGWATWRDRAMRIDYKMDGLTTNLNKIKLFMALQRGRPNWCHLDYRWYLNWFIGFLQNESDTGKHWDLPWIYYGLMRRTVSIFPSVNLIQNIGFGSHATHTGDKDSPLASLSVAPVDFPLIHPHQITFSRSYELECVRNKWSSFKPSLFQDVRVIYFHIKVTLARLRTKFRD